MQRYTNHPFPPYTYVPGKSPHPIGDSGGHGCPGPELMCAAVQETDDGPDRMPSWEGFEVYLWAIDLFNHGYYWESHEAWEGIWHLVGRDGPVADFLKGLIKLAAAGVKALEGNVAGVQRHARRADELLGQIESEWYGRLHVPSLRRRARQLVKLDEVEPLPNPTEPFPILGIFLEPMQDKTAPGC